MMSQTPIVQQEKCVVKLKGERDRLVGRLNYQYRPDFSLVGLDRATEYALNQQLAQKLRRVEHALERARQGSYGYCEECGQPMWERLLEIPYAERCVECQHRAERRMLKQLRRSHYQSV